MQQQKKTVLTRHLNNYFDAVHFNIYKTSNLYSYRAK